MTARDIMTSNPQCVTPEDTLQKAAQVMRDVNVGLVPVVESSGSKTLVGVITDRDITIRHVAEGHGGSDHKVREAMSKADMVTCGPDDDVKAVMKAMADAQVRRVPVVDGGELVGIIAQADLALDTGEDGAVGETVEQISKPSKGH
jgi:CBS domain-containing protein